MASTTQTVPIKCPHCGFENNIPVDGKAVIETTVVIASDNPVVGFFKSVGARIRNSLSNKAAEELKKANAWIVWHCSNPKCPAGKFEYNTNTGEVRE